MKWPRRFCDQHASFSSVQKGASLPLLTVRIRSAANPQARQVVLDGRRPPFAERRGCTRRCRGCRSAPPRSPWSWSTWHPVGVLLQRAPSLIGEVRAVEREEHVGERLFRVQLVERLLRCEESCSLGEGAAGGAGVAAVSEALAAPVSPRVVVVVARRAAASSCRIRRGRRSRRPRKREPFSDCACVSSNVRLREGVA